MILINRLLFTFIGCIIFTTNIFGEITISKIKKEIKEVVKTKLLSDYPHVTSENITNLLLLLIMFCRLVGF